MFHDPTFYVLVAFVLFFLAAGRPLGKALRGMLDGKIQDIQAEIENSNAKRDTAQKFLNEAKVSYHQSLHQAEEIKQQVKSIAAEWEKESQVRMKSLSEKRKKIATDRLHMLENRVRAELLETIANQVIEKLRKKLEDQPFSSFEAIEKALAGTRE